MQESGGVDLIATKQTLHRISDGANLVSWLSGQAVIKINLRKIHAATDSQLTLKVSEAKNLVTMLNKLIDIIDDHPLGEH